MRTSLKKIYFSKLKLYLSTFEKQLASAIRGSRESSEQLIANKQYVISVVFRNELTHRSELGNVLLQLSVLPIYSYSVITQTLPSISIK